MARDDRWAPEWDDQAYREQSRSRALLEKIWLKNQVDIASLIQQEKCIPVDWDIVPHYQGTQLVSFTEDYTREIPKKCIIKRKPKTVESYHNYMVVEKFTREATNSPDEPDPAIYQDFCIIQETGWDKLYTLLQKDPATGNRCPALPVFFTKNYRFVPWGIEFERTNSSGAVRYDTLRKR